MDSTHCSGTCFILQHPLFDHIPLRPIFCFLYEYLGDEKRSISEFGYSEIELVLSIFLKQLWGSNPSNTSSLLFQHLTSPT